MPDRTSPEYASLNLANMVFGGYFSSRWSANLREDKGFTYGARFARPNVAGKNSRVSFPLSWGGEKRAAAEFEKSFSQGPVSRVLGGAAITERTKLVYVCDPNNPTGTMSSRAELDAFFERVPDHVLTVLDQAYFEYVDDPDYADGIDEYFKAGRQVIVLRTFSKIYGLAGARVGYGIGPAELVTALGKTRRAFDLTTPAQVAALASLDSPGEVERRRQANAEGRAELERILTGAGYRVTAPAVGNFVFVDLGEDAQPWFEAMLHEGVIVRPLAGFGAPHAIRVTVGTPDDHAFLAEAVARVRTATAAS